MSAPFEDGPELRPVPTAQSKGEPGQAMAEFALLGPILVLLMFGMTFAAFYAFRTAVADWGLFITGVAEGVYDQPASGQARLSVPWADLRAGLQAAPLSPAQRQVRSVIDIQASYPFIFGLQLEEAQRGMSYFRLWRFYPGPPPGDFE